MTQRNGAAEAVARALDAPPVDPVLRAVAAALAQGRIDEAEARLRPHAAANRGDPVAARMLAEVALHRGRLGVAESLLRQLAAAAPGYLPVRYQLAHVLMLAGKADGVLVELAPLLAAAPGHVGGRALQAQALMRVGEVDAAATLLAALVGERPDDPRLLLALGQALRAARRQGEAVAAFRRAIAAAPGFGEAWWNLANMKVAALAPEDEPALRAALADARGEDRHHLGFALARLLEEAGRHDAAFAAYERANADRRALLPPEPAPGRVELATRARALFTPAFLADRAGGGHPSHAPIFILGMQRSGSTLLEQMLALHPDIEGTQELAELPRLAGELAGKGDYPAILAHLSADHRHALGEAYLKQVAAQRKTGRRHFIDKQPANWVHAGLIRLILPNARIIDMRRDPVACCLSMFRQHFARGAAFTYSLDTLAAEYRAYAGLMAHFGWVAPGMIRPVRLEALIADAEGVLRALLADLGLAFAPECLRFFDSPRAVFTPSSEQVRRPLNDDGARIAAAFAPHLGPLRAALAGVD